MMIRLLLVILVFKAAEGLICYQCQDTSSEDGKDSCQTYVRTMRYYRRRFEQSGTIIPDKYIKDCTDFTVNRARSGEVFCYIASVEAQGNVKSFIRGCSDGLTFFDSEYNDNFRNVLPDNQTTCSYSGTGFLACVTMCTGDFCNGPSGTTSVQPNMVMLALASFLLKYLFWL